MSLFVSYSKTQNKGKKRSFQNIEDIENSPISAENSPKKTKLVIKLPGMVKKKSKAMPLGELNSTASNDFNLSMTTDSETSPLGHPEHQGPQQKGQRRKRISDAVSKMKTPQPMVVARRNARERNRVKQVNNGFACLRQHIPDEIAEAFETPGSSRSASKKLSKVETLRMAVEYIRNLEQLLQLDNSDSMSNSNLSFLSESSMPATPPPEQPQAYFYAIRPRHSFGDNDEFHNSLDNSTEITIINGQQYVRIPGTNTFELIEPEIFENEENLQPLSHRHHHQHQQQQKLNNNNNNNNNSNANNNNIFDEPITTFGQQKTSDEYINITDPRLHEYISKETPANSSPSGGGFGVQAALSPAPTNAILNIKQEQLYNHHHQQHQLMQQQQLQQQAQLLPVSQQQRQQLDSFYTLKLKLSPASLLDENSNNRSHLSSNYDDLFLQESNSNQQHLEQLHQHEQHYGGLLNLKTEIKDESSLLSDEASLNSDNIIEAMNWWNEQQRRIDILNRSEDMHDENSNSSSFIS